MYFYNSYDILHLLLFHNQASAKIVKKRKPNYPEECLNMITVHGVPEVIQLKGVSLIISTIGLGILTMKMI